jgi:hypothetical protein
VSFDPHPEPELEALRKDTFRALEITDEHAEIRATSRGELEAQVLESDRAQATAPQDTSSLGCGSGGELCEVGGRSPVDFRYRAGVVPQGGGSAAAMAKAQFTPAHTRAALVAGG